MFFFRIRIYGFYRSSVVHPVGIPFDEFVGQKEAAADFVNVPVEATPESQPSVESDDVLDLARHVTDESCVQPLNISTQHLEDKLSARIFGDVVRAVQSWNMFE